MIAFDETGQASCIQFITFLLEQKETGSLLFSIAEYRTPDQRMAKISEWPNSKWMAKFLSFSKQRMAMAIHQIGKIQIGEWPVKTLSLANPYAY